MSIKRRLQYQCRRVGALFSSLALPRWVASGSMKLFLIFFLAAVGAAYVCKTSVLATGGYQMRDLEEKVAALELANQKIQVEIAASSSLASIEEKLKGLNMVGVSNIRFVGPLGGGPVAKK